MQNIEGRGGWRRTPCPPRTHKPITRIVRRASNVPDLRVQQSLPPTKVFAVQVLDAPEAPGRDGAFLGVVGQLHGGLTLGTEREASRGGCERPEEPREETGHGGGHQEDCDGSCDENAGCALRGGTWSWGRRHCENGFGSGRC